MYKRVARFEVQYRKFRDFRKALENVDAIWKRKGLTPYRNYLLEFGLSNVVIAEWEYGDFAQYERDSKKFVQDEELRNAWRAVLPYIVQGSLLDELWRPLVE